MEFIKFWKDKERMCKYQMKKYKCCCPNGRHAWTHELDCPITKLGSSINIFSCAEIIERHPEEVEKIVKEWVKEHQVDKDKVEKIEKYQSKYTTRFDVNFWIKDDKIFLRETEDGGGKRDLTEEEIDKLISKYEQLEALEKKLTDEMNIIF